MRILLQLVSDKQCPIVLELVRTIIYYHDLGKINPVFQKNKMGNSLHINPGGLDDKHSFYGKILFDNLFYSDFVEKFPSSDNRVATAIFFLLSQTIDRHHTSLRDIDHLAKKIQSKETQRSLDDLERVADAVFVNHRKFFPYENLRKVYTFKEGEYYDIRKLFSAVEQQEALFYLYKTVYSLLITSDYYATLDFVQNISYFDKISTITPKLVSNCEENFYKFKFNKSLKNSISKNPNADTGSMTDLNKLRTQILFESDNNIVEFVRKYPNQRVFYLNVPTGGGKTNVSLKLALTLLKSKKIIKRVFYVFPFINLIEQNHDVIKETFGLNEELSPIYSTSPWSIQSENDQEQLQYALDNEFLNHPFIVMSNVNFFNTFIKSGKAANYRLVNLANSVVIIDEIQGLDDERWTLFNDIIEFGAKYLNIYFIIMSATLPKLDTLSDVGKSNVACNLINNPLKYSNHVTFKNRVSIEYRDNVNTLDQFLDLLKNNIHSGMHKILLVVNTVKHSLELYKKIRDDEKVHKLNFHTHLLNSTILPHRRKEIIKKMKYGSHDILVSTQSVEAGIDIDCDFGIRDFAVFDSVEQIAGRINRNFNNPNPAKLLITNLKKDDRQTAQMIYGKSYRWKAICKDFAHPGLVKSFLTDRNFDFYYAKVLQEIKKRNKSVIHDSSQNFVRRGIRGLNFEELNKTDVITQDSVAVIVNTCITKDEFTKPELEFIEYFGMIDQNVISGENVWSKYKEFVKDFRGGHVERKINTRIWSSILSKFTINIRRHHVDNHSITKGSEEGIRLLKNQYYSDIEGITYLES